MDQYRIKQAVVIGSGNEVIRKAGEIVWASEFRAPDLQRDPKLPMELSEIDSLLATGHIEKL